MPKTIAQRQNRCKENSPYQNKAIPIPPEPIATPLPRIEQPMINITQRHCTYIHEGNIIFNGGANSGPNRDERSNTQNFSYGSYMFQRERNTERPTRQNEAGPSLIQQNEETYSAIDRFGSEKDWVLFAELGIDAATQQSILESRGEVGNELKMQMLKYWKKQRAHYENPGIQLIERMEDFLKRKTKMGICKDFDSVSRTVANAIPNEEWLRFARLKLELKNDEIKLLRRKYGKFSEEMLYELLNGLHMPCMDERTDGAQE